MPNYPHVAPNIAAMAGSVYSNLGHKLAAFDGPKCPLHVGDTWMEPAVGCRMQDLTVAEYPGMHKYVGPRGYIPLLDALGARVEQRTGLAAAHDELMVGAGGTGVLGALVGALVSPGDEVLIAAPFWPLIAGITRCFNGKPVPVPLVGRATTAEQAVQQFRQAKTDRTVAIYLNTPNNPTGVVYPASWIRAIVTWAASQGLWIISDEVYEDYVYEGEHTYCRPLAPERTFSLHSFSKAYGMAGNRCGYAVGPTDALAHVVKVSTHTFYSAPTASQIAALRVLGAQGDAWVANAREQYKALGRMAADVLGVPAPGGSTFLFVDVAEHLDDRGLMGLLDDVVQRGLLVAPGPAFGPYPHHVRLCFTSAAPDVVERGVNILAKRLGR